MDQSLDDVPVLTITQFTNAVKLCLEGAFPNVWIQGEISNCKPHSSGHLYFSLKDAGAQVSAIMFRASAANLKTYPKDGDKVIVRGEISVYPQSGKYQILVRELKQVGLGDLLQKLEEVKVKLHKLGWFRSDRKKALPKLPKTIGVVTSPTGAAIQDMLNILTRRFSGFHLILNPVKVQGEGSAEEIAQAIRQFNAHNLVDVMIVGRGGGSFEDLWAFNEEIVAQAIYESKIPIISAVGHETDHCIADYVADLRAPTPSAAAEIVIGEKAQMLEHLVQLQKRMQQTVSQLIRTDRQRLEGIKRHPLLQTPYKLLGPAIQSTDMMRCEIEKAIQRHLTTQHLRIDHATKQLQALKPSSQIAYFKQKLDHWEKTLRFTAFQLLEKSRQSILSKIEALNLAARKQIENKRNLFDPEAKRKNIDLLWRHTSEARTERLKTVSTLLQSIDPKNVLKKGYCILFSEKDHSVITSVQNVKKQQEVRLVLSDGELISTIKDMIPSEHSRSFNPHSKL